MEEKNFEPTRSLEKASRTSIGTLSTDDAVEWLKSRTKGGKCPMCGWSTWNILSSDDQILAIQYVRFDKALMTPVMLTECDRCAFVASFMVSSVQAWIRDGKPEFKDDANE